jgi:hypothetical protein
MSKWMFAGVFVVAIGLIAGTAGCKKGQGKSGDDAACSACAGCAGCAGCAACGGEEACGACGACAACGEGCGKACGCGEAGGCGGCGVEPKVASADAKHAAMLMKQYRKWSKMNAEAFLSKQHARHRVYDYANAAASRPFRDGSGTYKPGAVVVKEGWKQGKRSMVWFMEKRGAGYDKEHGDWWYATVTGAGKVVNAGKVESCIGCHEGADHDYVFGVPK